jgi:oligoendopeptidase F
MTNTSTGAENIRWNLASLYAGLDDPKIDADIQALVALYQGFNAAHKGRLAETLGPAVAAYARIRMLEDKVMAYLFLAESTNVADAAVKAKIADTERILSGAAGEHMTFFVLELVALDDAVLAAWYAKDPAVARHRPWLEHERVFKPHLLSEPVEAALAKRAPFGPAAWGSFFDELEADLEASHRGETRTLTELLHLMTESRDAAERAELLHIIDGCLAGPFAKYSAQTLYMVAGAAAVENRERAYATPLQARNKANRIPDAVVDTLHRVVGTVAGPLAQRYYRLKAAHLGLKTLKWSDRNAPMPFADTTAVPFADARSTVLAAYESFSPALAALVRSFFDERRIDAPALKGKRSGAFNYTAVLPGGQTVSYVLLNYLGSNRDVMTLAHELGHGVHGLLAGRAQGVLMAQAPIAYAETASVFGEMTTFRFLKESLARTNDKRSLLALLMGTIDDVINTTVRQISFSNFERRLHGLDAAGTRWGAPAKRSVAELNALWLEATQQLYGPSGDVFTYENVDRLWSYIPHFHSPFYVYGYAFGELLTQSLYAQQARCGARFEPLYLDLLSSGATRDVVELLRPFGLDPTDENFWVRGIESGLGAMVAEAEQLSRELGV